MTEVNSAEVILNQQLDGRAKAVAAVVDMVDATDERTLRNFCLMTVAMVTAPDTGELDRRKANGMLIAMAMQILHDRFHLEAGIITGLVETLGEAVTKSILKADILKGVS